MAKSKAREKHRQYIGEQGISGVLYRLEVRLFANCERLAP